MIRRRALRRRLASALERHLIPYRRGAPWEGKAPPWLAPWGDSLPDVPLAERKITASVQVSRRALLQASVDVERFIREELAKTIQAELDRAVVGFVEGVDPDRLEVEVDPWAAAPYGMEYRTTFPVREPRGFLTGAAVGATA